MVDKVTVTYLFCQISDTQCRRSSHQFWKVGLQLLASEGGWSFCCIFHINPILLLLKTYPRRHCRSVYCYAEVWLECHCWTGSLELKDCKSNKNSHNVAHLWTCLTWSWHGFSCFSVYYKSNEWSGIHGIRENDQMAWLSSKNWSKKGVWLTEKLF